MVKAGSAIQTIDSKTIHTTCLVHAFYRVAEKVRDEFLDVDKVD